MTKRYRGPYMDWLPGFAWPLPRAFSAAVSICRFEQGDVFYDHSEAYQAWGSDAARSVWVQVQDPPRSARSAPADALGNRFVANWSSPVTLELGEAGDSAPTTIRCTQGGLFTCLWRGDRGVLCDVEQPADALPLPAAARDLQKHLEAAAPALRAAARRPREAGVMFVFVVDESSESSLAKAQTIESALASGSDAETADLAPAEAGVPDGMDFHPTLRLRGAIASESADFVQKRLKAALYAPTRSGGEGGADRFKLERHGLLVDLAESSP